MPPDLLFCMMCLLVLRVPQLTMRVESAPGRGGGEGADARLRTEAGRASGGGSGWCAQRAP